LHFLLPHFSLLSSSSCLLSETSKDELTWGWVCLSVCLEREAALYLQLKSS
jgi:hypothetical protein